ncbi:hydroxyneurosporene methyltransferase [Gloeocapsopsis crepidinum LEGE 06123]|uniref:Hydroxyneurosporene methyltransferase n=1 Tax=Gloeocapsopsis crepidinum LEGE 06123 TaxID=588587 RepID=A0ABR9UUL0_9CHRO|nr:methyltransferase [Gloeocapsopsis crepidinum]MBE9191728.1 hydroxyneurosporene methyltransferase [Gloeocapsopsis crepidinum LEGE 06123]
MTTTLAQKTNNMEAKKKVFGMIQAFWESQCLHVATRLDIFNILSEGSQSIETLAEKTATKVDKLYIILRALGHLGVLEEQPGRVFAATEVSELLVTNAGPSIGHFAMHIIEPAQWDAWKVLETCLHTGEVPFERANGKTVYEFTRDEDWSGDVFIKAMSFLTDHAVDALLDVFDFSRFNTVMDVGGGQGGLISKIVKRFGCKGILFDLPYVTETAPAHIEKQGVAADAVQIVTGDVFKGLPTGADAIVMKYFLSSWKDEDALAILRHCKAALPKHGKVVLLQCIVPDLGEPTVCPDGIIPSLFATQIMVAVPGGAWRTQKEYERLFTASGFQLENVVPTGTNLSALEFGLVD